MSQPNPRPAQGPGSGPATARTADRAQAGEGRGRRRRRPAAVSGAREGLAGWLFVAPVIVVLGLFLVAADPHGALGEPVRLERARAARFTGDVHFVGGHNYTPAVHRGRV